MIYKLRQNIHAVWIYLNQSLTPNPEEKSVWQIKQFLYLYQIKLLESCWLQESFNPHHEEYRQEN